MRYLVRSNKLFSIHSEGCGIQVSRRAETKQQIVRLLTTAPEGLGSRDLLRLIDPEISQPTLSRILSELAAEGAVVKTGAARATRYHATTDRRMRSAVRSRLLHRKIAERLARNPVLRDAAKRRLQELREVNPHGRPYHDRWAELLEGDLSELLRVLSEPGQYADDLRKESPFTTLLPLRERNRVFEELAV